MLVQAESKAQGWRAVAVLDTNVEALLFVGRSSTQVRSEYAVAFNEFYETEEDRAGVETIKLQQWQGAADAGKWIDKAELKLPAPSKQLVKVAA